MYWQYCVSDLHCGTCTLSSSPVLNERPAPAGGSSDRLECAVHRPDERLVMFINACRLDQRFCSLVIRSIWSSNHATTSHPVNRSDWFLNDCEQDYSGGLLFISSPSWFFFSVQKVNNLRHRRHEIGFQNILKQNRWHNRGINLGHAKCLVIT